MLRLITLSLLLVLAICAPAQATDFSPNGQPLTVAERSIYDLALTHWEGEPTSCVNVQVEVAPAADLAPAEGIGSNCRVQIADDALAFAPVYACAVFAHEQGHALFGFGHTDDPSDVMYEHGAVTPPECYVLAEEPAVEAEERPAVPRTPRRTAPKRISVSRYTPRRAARRAARDWLAPLVRPGNGPVTIRVPSCRRRGRWHVCRVIVAGASTCRGSLRVRPIASSSAYAAWTPRLRCH